MRGDAAKLFGGASETVANLSAQVSLQKSLVVGEHRIYTEDEKRRSWVTEAGTNVGHQPLPNRAMRHSAAGDTAKTW